MSDPTKAAALSGDDGQVKTDRVETGGGPAAPCYAPGNPAAWSRLLSRAAVFGAFTWGFLDRLLEEQDLAIDMVSGASAGALNAVLLADGLAAGGPERHACASSVSSGTGWATPPSTYRKGRTMPPERCSSFRPVSPPPIN